MKHRFLAMMTFALCMMLITNCSKDKKEEVLPSLVGTWLGKYDGNDFAVVITDDNRGIVYEGYVGSPVYADGTYEFDVKNFSISYSYDGELIIIAAGQLSDNATRIDGTYEYKEDETSFGGGEFFLVKQEEEDTVT